MLFEPVQILTKADEELVFSGSIPPKIMEKNTNITLKYRPQLLDDLIGQKVLCESISNAIRSKKLPSGYLFTGIHGVGKTSTARIVARYLNCLNVSPDSLENLCTDKLCQNCEEIKNSNSMDCLEVDGASNTGVDNVRELIQFCKYRPTTSKYKIIIIDECHQLSRAAFAALLKTLEEPPEWLLWLLCSTEYKKIPTPIVSRTQRYHLNRVKSVELFNFVKKISEKEGTKLSDEVLKLVVKISTGSVRDSLSLLQRVLLVSNNESGIQLKEAQKIFGYFDKSNLIELFRHIFEGEEKKVIEVYKSIYDQGIAPKIFLNDFLEILYYLKNINSLNKDGTNFSLNDEEFNSIKELASLVSNETLLLFWEFTIKNLEQIEICSNQHIAMEMFLLRLIHLKEISNFSKKMDDYEISNDVNANQIDENRTQNKKKIEDDLFNAKGKTIGQIKNVVQEKKQTEKPVLKTYSQTNLQIKTFEDLIELCNSKKEIKLKHELETNVNLVSFENKRIEISFNENLDKEFIKDLSGKLYEWTSGDRWIISLSKQVGEPSKKEKKIILKKELLKNAKKSEVYKKVLEGFPDAELIDINTNKEKKND